MFLSGPVASRPINVLPCAEPLCRESPEYGHRNRPKPLWENSLEEILYMAAIWV
jgi:hypothetical protein